MIIYRYGGIMMLEDILCSDDVVLSINNNLDYLFELIPELKAMVGFLHKHPHHNLDVWEHTLYALSLSVNDFEVRLVLLLHDIGKPHCYVEGDVRNFRGHPVVSSEMSRVILERLGFNSEFIEEVCYLVKYHDMPIKVSKVLENKELVIKRYLVQYCDAYAHHPLKLEKRVKYLKRTRDMLRENGIENIED